VTTYHTPPIRRKTEAAFSISEVKETTVIAKRKELSTCSFDEKGELVDKWKTVEETVGVTEMNDVYAEGDLILARKHLQKVAWHLSSTPYHFLALELEEDSEEEPTEEEEALMVKKRKRWDLIADRPEEAFLPKGEYDNDRFLQTTCDILKRDGFKEMGKNLVFPWHLCE
jgi:hypothetical protein